jgi:anthranilate phosphoribosyltransferase
LPLRSSDEIFCNTITISAAIRYALEGCNLGLEEAIGVMGQVLDGMWTPAQLGAWLAALAAKGESVEELTGFVSALRKRMVPVHHEGYVIDVCGTGGDYSRSFNASTAAALIASATGVTVAKCGNRAASSLCGSADLLEAVGVQIELDPMQAQDWLKECGFAFLFSQRYHPTLRQLAPIRRELGFRTVFNLLGPLCNPALPAGQVLGVAQRGSAPLLAEVLSALGVKRAMVVHGLDGLDEFSLSAPSEVHELEEGHVRHYIVEPSEFGLHQVKPEVLRGGSPAENAVLLQRLVSGERWPLRDFCLLNAAAALVVAKRAIDLREGMQMAAAALDSGAVAEKLRILIARSSTCRREGAKCK